MNTNDLEEKLKERIKELTCLYEISKTISQSNKIDKGVLEQIIYSLKKAWKYNFDAIVEIQINDQKLITTEITSKTVFQTCSIQINNSEIGYIKVHYPQSNYTQSSFLDDEQKLLDTVALEIANYAEKLKIKEKKAVLRKSAERMDRLSLLGKMNAGIAHELNAPLSNILGFAELIKSTNTDPEIDTDISIIIKSSIHAKEIVKKLLYFSSEMPQQLEIEEIEPIITFAITILKQNFLEKKIKHEIIFKNTHTSIKIDAVQITQVLLNILINGIYASPEKSTIKIVVEEDLENLILSIKDLGTGIPDDLKQKIFEPFFTTKSKIDGFGLGLSIVAEIVKTHNGKITVEDNFPTGSIFTLKLPLN